MILAPKHSIEPPVVVESFRDSPSVLNIGPDDDTQDMSGEREADGTSSPVPSQASGSSSTDHSTSTDTPSSSIGKKSKKRKLGKREATNELLEKMITAQENSDKLLLTLEEKRIKMEERQVEIDAQMCREERKFKLQMMQMMMMRQDPPPPPHFPMHSSFNFNAEFDPDATQEGL